MARNESDTAWKEILDAFFKDYLDYCLPDLSKLIDWSQQCESLDKELQAIMKNTASGKHLVKTKASFAKKANQICSN